MTFREFCRLVGEKGWTLAQLRCDVPPTDELLEVMGTLGLARYESFVLRAERLAVVR